MTKIYIVKTGEHFLCDGEAGDIGMTPEAREAKSFLSYAEARDTADKNADPGYEIVPKDASDRERN